MVRSIFLTSLVLTILDYSAHHEPPCPHARVCKDGADTDDSPLRPRA
eukprot:SAG22_NODE_13564_length_402_cov_0.851485_2_plen_46_part_01